MLLHGRPGSRLSCPDDEATEAAGVRLITIDRSGYGRSDPRPGRTLSNWGDDYVELAGELDLPPCPVIGWSASRRYPFGLGFRAPELVSIIGVVAGRGPIDKVPGAIAEISPEDRVILELLTRDRAAGLQAIAQDGAWFEAGGWEEMFSTRWWGDADDWVLTDPETLEAMKGLVREGARQGAAGMVVDDVISFTPWSFSAADVRQPVYLWWGKADLDITRISVDYLAATIPGATLVTYPDEGHLLPINRWGEVLAADLAAAHEYVERPEAHARDRVRVERDDHRARSCPQGVEPGAPIHGGESSTGPGDFRWLLGQVTGGRRSS